MIAGALVARCVAKANGIDPWAITITTPFRFDALGMGALVAVMGQQANDQSLRRVGWRMATIGTLAVIGIAIYEGGYRMDGRLAQTIGFTAFAMLSAGVIAVLVSYGDKPEGILRVFESKILQHLGNRSYAIYVMHMPLLVVMTVIYQQKLAAKDRSGTLDVQCYLLAIFVCIVFAELSWHIFEKQFLKLKKYFPKGAAISSTES